MIYPQIARETAKRLVEVHFKNDYNDPFKLTDGQSDLFLSIFLRQFPRNITIASTQYGKSDVISIALLMRSQVYSEPWAIVSGDAPKAGIIMSRVIQHAFDHPRFYKQLEIDPNVSLDRLRRERSKDHINWMKGGAIKIFSADARNRQRVKSALTGFGSPNIIGDESSLIPDDVQAMILRMLGGHTDNYLMKVGNPFYRNHFLKSWHSDKYNKLFIDYHQGLAEGRYTPAFIEEMRLEPFFDVLYECKFPSEDELMIGGFRKLIPDKLLEDSFISPEEGAELMQGQVKLGADFAGGGNDRSAYVARWPGVMKLISTNRIADTMQQVPIIEDYMSEFNVSDRDTSLDYGGIGQGVGDRLREKDHNVNCIMFGQSAPEMEKHKYKNMRAYMYYQLHLWLLNGGKIIRDDGFYELLSVNYKTDSERKFQIQPKEDLKKQMKQLGIFVSSPDIADAAALTFADNSALIGEDDIEFI